MKITVTAKIKIQPSNEQKELLDATLKAYQEACCFVSEYIFQTHDLAQKSLNAELYHPIRNSFGLRAQMTQSVLRTVTGSYRTILANQHKWIKAVFNQPQLNLVWNRDYSLSKEAFSLNTLAGRIKIPYLSKGMEKYFDREVYTFGTTKLVIEKGKYFLHIPVAYEAVACSKENVQNIVGVDRGVNFIVATYDSQGTSAFVSGRQAKQVRGHYKRLRQDLQGRQTPSSRQRLKKIGQRENRWMRDVNHCVSKALVQNNPSHTLFVLEDLSGIRQTTEKVLRKNRYVMVSWAYYDLAQKLKYKAALNQDLVIEVNPAYTSQTCPVCGHTEKRNRDKRKHRFACKKCGYRSNDDRIGAMNLYHEGIKFLGKDTVAAEHISIARGAVNHPMMQRQLNEESFCVKGRSHCGASTAGQLQAQHL